ncbi:TPA: hypothetical protein DCQ82_00620 [Candidatus Veblenbacteria bacterium]|nr:hypothetical protein [Candidatus Veblenbacteria bacterium]
MIWISASRRWRDVPQDRGGSLPPHTAGESRSLRSGRFAYLPAGRNLYPEVPPRADTLGPPSPPWVGFNSINYEANNTTKT